MEELSCAGLCYLIVLVFLVCGILYAVGKILFGD